MPDPDDLDGCEVDMSDPAHVSTDDDVDALMCFGDLPWVGSHEGPDGRMYPTLDPDAVAQRVAELRELADGA